MVDPYNGVSVECMEGWRELYEPLIDLCKLKGIKVLQVKEKFGMLRFYTNASDLDTLIRAAEDRSEYVCESCGTSGYLLEEPGLINKVTKGPSRTSSWIKSLCDPCREARDVERESRGVSAV